MANPSQLERLRQGVAAWNRWREEHPDEPVDLSEADLSEADLSDAHLRDAHLHEATLPFANLAGADLSYAHLYPVVLLRLAGTAGYSMAKDLEAYVGWVIPVREYSDSAALINGLDDYVILPAEAKLEILRP